MLDQLMLVITNLGDVPGRWPLDEGFPRRALSAALRHQFDLFTSPRLDLDRFATLDDVAVALFDTGKVAVG